MVGIPFKMLDKKSEKKLMLSRRKELTKSLQETSVAIEVFELALILLCQQTRTVAIYFGQINEVVLKWILKDKKITSEVESLFTKIFLIINDQQEDSISLSEVENMKVCGLTKDVSSIRFN